ncbi:hypothetical protein ACTWPT_05000 [Nonomuraea sp. 3N208]|uniref:hypothetical protein n=1 Tax=Nonomuraea sp. 3N208 TaxID=3457421 RepID=UPI003FCC550A
MTTTSNTIMAHEPITVAWAGSASPPVAVSPPQRSGPPTAPVGKVSPSSLRSSPGTISAFGPVSPSEPALSPRSKYSTPYPASSRPCAHQTGLRSSVSSARAHNPLPR